MNAESGIIYDCIVVGGGISGISFAHNLSFGGKKVLLLEKNENIGGQIQTYKSAKYPDFWVETGSHTCYNSYTSLLTMIAESDLNNKIYPLDKCSYVLSTKKGIKGFFSQISLLPLIFNAIKIFFSSKADKTVREYFRPIVGGKNYDKLFNKAFRAVICQPADEYPAELFLKKRKDRLKDIPRKYSFEEGIQSMLYHITEKDNFEVKTGNEVESITLDNGLYQINTSEGITFRSYNIGIATNPKIAAALLKDIEPQINKLLNTIPLYDSETLNVIIGKDKLSLEKVAGIISDSDEFMSAVSRDSIEHDHLRSFSFHFMGNSQSEEDKINIVCKVLNIEKNDILEHSFVNHILPSPRKEHVNIIQQVNDLRIRDTIFLLGNYYYGMSLEDCVKRSQDEYGRFKKLNSLS